MSAATLNDYLYKLKLDRAMQAALAADAPAHAASLGLSAEAQTAIAKKDVAALYRLGAHPLLITPFSRFAGITPPDYADRMRPLIGTRTFESEPT